MYVSFLSCGQGDKFEEQDNLYEQMHPNIVNEDEDFGFHLIIFTVFLSILKSVNIYFY